MKTLGEELKEAREKAGFTLKEVEEKVGVSNSYLSELERNIKTNPSNELLKKLSELYSYNYLKLFLRKGQSYSEINKYDFMYEALFDLISIEELDNLTEKEKTIAKFIRFYIKDYKPSITEVKDLLLSKSNDKNKPLFAEEKFNDQEIKNAIEAVYNDFEDITKIPVISNMESDDINIKDENIFDYESTPTELVQDGEYFYYKINDDSMINAGIVKDDIVLIRKQNIVHNKDIVLIIDNSNNATLKRVFTDNGTCVFQSENPSYDPIVDPNNKINIIGKVISLKRKYE